MVRALAKVAMDILELVKVATLSTLVIIILRAEADLWDEKVAKDHHWITTTTRRAVRIITILTFTQNEPKA